MEIHGAPCSCLSERGAAFVSTRILENRRMGALYTVMRPEGPGFDCSRMGLPVWRESAGGKHD